MRRGGAHQRRRAASIALSISVANAEEKRADVPTLVISFINHKRKQRQNNSAYHQRRRDVTYQSCV